jgi:phosphate transport system substrate-binding protein
MPITCSKDHLNAARSVRTPPGHATGRRRVVRALGRCGAAAAVWPAAAFMATAQEPLFRIGGAGAAIGTMNSALASLALRGRSVTTRVVSHLGSVGSLRAVEQGALDMALISRPLQVDERMRGLQAWEYGRTPFALATSMAGVSGLTRAQLAEMIEDPRAAWPDGTPVRLVLRPKSDGDYVLLASMGPLVELALERANARAGMVIAITDQEAADAVARLRGGLGTCSLSLLRSGLNNLVPLALDGVAPTVANIENASYRIVNRMHIATLGAPTGVALELINFLQLPDGLALLAQLGHSTRLRR